VERYRFTQFIDRPNNSSCVKINYFLAQVLHCVCHMAVVLDNLYSQENYLISKKLLDATHLRHEALSNNLANVETPGFKRRDLPKSFSVELRRAVDRKDFRRVKGLLPRSIEDRQAKPVRMDGNTVQLDEEMLAMNRNALNYEYLTGAVGGSIKELNSAIRGRV